MKKKLVMMAIAAAVGCTTFTAPVLAGQSENVQTEEWSQEDIDFWENYEWEAIDISSIPDLAIPEATIGWHQNEKGWWYVCDNQGSFYAGGAVTIGDNRYVFNDYGYMMTGWIANEVPVTAADVSDAGWRTEWYYADKSGAIQTGWQKVNGKWYYLGSEGTMQTGWQKVDGKWYYLNKSGAMQTGWQQIGGKWYYLNKSGAMQTGWQKIGGKWYYLYGDGHMAKSTWIGKYYVNQSGAWTRSK